MTDRKCIGFTMLAGNEVTNMNEWFKCNTEQPMNHERSNRSTTPINSYQWLNQITGTTTDDTVVVFVFDE